MKHSMLLLASWIILLLLAALLPPLDSRANPAPLLMGAIRVVAIGLSAYTLVATFGYFYGAWHRVGSVPNRVEYAIWLGFETALFLFVLVWVLRGAVLDVVHRIGIPARP